MSFQNLDIKAINHFNMFRLLFVCYIIGFVHELLILCHIWLPHIPFPIKNDLNRVCATF